ncbi:UNVERIFIED_CONTAM: Rhodanese-like domain-containing protein 14, chloroplastic [Sesamum angustifolium]|uniref:Rhodanese-like domain-containing protein 14, chloroplastic n=1 Tax=Sesamum angustifolium TaxID=2727405 RepID=A0AAW2LHB1_9LAMI
MAAVTSISPHPSSSPLYHKFHPSPLAYNLNSSVESNSSCFATKAIQLSNRRRAQASIDQSEFRIQQPSKRKHQESAEEDWRIKRQVLLEKKVRSVDVKEALRLQTENKFFILDVRPEAEFKEAHPAGAINVQIYRLIKEWTAWDIARRAAFAFFGVESKLPKDAKIIVACSAGGTTKPTQNLPEGQQSRSLIAAYLLVLNGYTNVYHLEGGIYNWFKEGLPTESEE